MIVDDTELILSAGEDAPGGPVRPLIHAERAGTTMFVRQLPSGQLHFDGPFALTPKQKKIAKQMFLRFNSALAGSVDRRALGKRWVRFPGDTLTVGLVACSQKKREFKSKARDLYQGDLFQKARRWCELFCDDWAILSAKHGLILPNDEIEPYDKVLPTKDEELRGWAGSVSFGCYMQWGEDTHYVLLAGEGYRSPFEEFNIRHLPSTAPMRGLGLGEQKSWLLKELTGAPPPKDDEERPKARRLKIRK